MFAIRSNTQLSSRILACFMAVVLAVGMMPMPAYAQEAQQALQAGSFSTQSGDSGNEAGDVDIQAEAQNFAVLDADTGVLTFYYGVPTGTAGTDFYEGFDTAKYGSPTDHPWTGGKVTAIVFDKSVEGHLAPTSTAYWFAGCTKVTAISGLEYLDTSHVTAMDGMFHYCTALVALDLSHFDTTNVTSFHMMFNNCSSLVSLDLSGFNTDSATLFSDMFASCKNLEEITFGEGFTVQSATSFEQTFVYCEKLKTLDLSMWNTSKATIMHNMFYGCSNLETLYLTNFDTSSVTRFNGMFNGCDKLSSVTLGEKFNCKGSGITYEKYWAMLPTPPEEPPSNGKWKNSARGVSCTSAEIQELTGTDIAGTWSWTQGIAVTVTSGEGGTAKATPANTGATGETVTLTATPDPDYEFVGWKLTSGENTGTLENESSNPTTFAFGSESGAVTATFKKIGHVYAFTVGALSATSFAYNGQVQVPTFKVRDADSGTVLVEGTDYTVSYKRNGTAIASPSNEGTYTVSVTGAGSYEAAGEQDAGTFTITTAISVSGTLACASGWTPEESLYTTWGTLSVMKPTASGDYERVSTQWPALSTFKLDYISPGSRITFTPQAASSCGTVTYTVPESQKTALTGIKLTAPYTKGTVRFSSMDYVAADRLYDPDTGADYTKDDDEAARTTAFSLMNGTQVKAMDASEREVPVSVIDGQSLVIKDDEAKLVAGAKYTISLGVRDRVFAGGYFATKNLSAVTQKVEVTLEDVGNGCIGANGVTAKAYSRGRAVIHYENPYGTPTSLFLYDGSGNLAGQATKYGRDQGGTFSTRFLEAGSYTICAVDRDAYGALANAGAGSAAKAPATLAELERFGFTASQLVKQTFRVQDNKLTDVGVKSPLMFPASSTASDIIDHVNSSVTAMDSYSDCTTITIVASLLPGVDTSALSDQRGMYRPKVSIYTNQKQIVDNSVATGRNWCWPRSLSINGKPVALTSFTNNHQWAMTNGWIEFDLFEVCPDYQGVESFPLTLSLTVPRSDYGRTQAMAYLNLPGRSNCIGVYDQVTDELSLVAPETVANKAFTAQGFTAANANVTLSVDGIDAATAKADEYGYYAAELTLPESVQDPTTFNVQASATWTSEGMTRSATSEVLDVTYSTTKASLKRLWMLTQNGQNGAWDYLLIYDNGAWSSMYKGYFLGSWTNRRFIWIAEFNNAEYATNVTCVVPKSEGDLHVPMTRDKNEADGWLSLSKPGAGWHVMSELGTQSLVGDNSLVAMGPRGTVDYRKGAAFIESCLSSGNAYVSEPVKLQSTPAGVYVTYDDIERQTLEEPEAYTGYSGLDAADVAAYISALNDNSNHMAIVEESPNAEGKLVKVDPNAAAAAYVGAATGQVDEWIAVAFDCDQNGAELANPVWMQLHHTVATSAVDMNEPLTLISNAKNKYAEYLDNIAAAIAAGKSAGDATTYCPCKEANNAFGGIPIKQMVARADDDLDTVRYFIWTEDSRGNSYIRTMERFGVAGTNDVAYRQYEYDERQLVITEWNGQTKQKTVMTYRLADSFVNGLADGQHDTDLTMLMNLWQYVGIQVQLGVNDAEDALIAAGKMEEGAVPVQSDFRLTAQAGDGVIDNMVNGLGSGVQWIFEGAEGGIKSATKWIENNNDRRKKILKKAGLISDWGNLSDSELQSLYKFIADNKSDCFEYESLIQQSATRGTVSPFVNAVTVKAMRGGLHKVYQSLSTATNQGKSIYQNGVAKTVTKAAESYCKKKSAEAFNKFLFDKKVNAELGMEEDVLSKYSKEYVDLVRELYDFEQNAKANGKANCIHWDAIPDDLYYTIKHERESGELANTRAERARSNGSVWPRGKYDPSGFVYEGMLSNPIEGATVTLYTRNETGGDARADYAQVVDSEKFGYEPNPQVTGVDGRYQWFVDVGFWQVRVTKDGYDPVSTGSSNAYGIGATKDLDGDGTDEAKTWWMPVLPEQIDVNIPLYSTAAPTLASVEGTAEGAVVAFSKPLKLDNVSAGMFTIGLDNAPSTSAMTIAPLDEDVAADGSLGPDGKPLRLARTFLVKYPGGSPSGGNHTVTVAFANSKGVGAVVSYAGTAAESGSMKSSFAVDKAASTISLTAQNKAYTGKAQAYTGKVTKTGSTGKVTYAYYSDAKCTKPVANSAVKNVGTYYVKATVAADAKYEAATSAAVAFKIIPKGTTITKAVAASKGITVKWKKKKAAQTTGYQVQYSPKSSFKSAKTVTVKGAKKTSAKVVKLKAKKKYWVRVRTYKKVGSTTYNSAWSKAKTIKTK